MIENVQVPVRLPAVCRMIPQIYGPGAREISGAGSSGADYGPGPDSLEEIVDKAPTALTEPTPTYTLEARLKHIEGSVLVRVLVGSDGSVKQARLGAHRLGEGLDEQAFQAAYSVRFLPAVKDGKAVAFWMQIQIHFRLNK
jgi:TonB family protein